MLQGINANFLLVYCWVLKNILAPSLALPVLVNVLLLLLFCTLRHTFKACNKPNWSLLGSRLGFKTTQSQQMPLLLYSYLVWLTIRSSYKVSWGKQQTGLIRVKEEGWMGFSEGWQGCSEGFPEGEARGKPRPSRIFFSDLYSISKTFFKKSDVSRRVNFFNAILVYFAWQIVNSHTSFFSWIFWAEYFCE